MRGLILPILALTTTGVFCVVMYQVFSRDYQYLQLIKLGDQLIEEELPYQAARAYGSAINLKPDNSLGYLKRAEAHQVQGDLAQALEDLLKASTLSGDVATVSLRLADIYYERGEFREAARHYSQVLSLDPDVPSILYQQGIACFRGGREEQAIAALSRAIELQDDFFEALYLRGAVYRSLDRNSEAEADFIRALELRPDEKDVRSALINLYLSDKNAAKVLELVQLEIDQQPQDPFTYLHLAEVHRLRGEHGEAIEAVNLALEQDPNLPEAYLRLGELWLAEGMRSVDHVALGKAVAALDSASKMDPSNGPAALALGRACLAIGDEEKAFSELQRAAEATPIQAEAHRLLGDLYSARRGYAEAITAYHIYLKLNGEDPSVVEKLGDAYMGMDNSATAADTYLQLVQLEPNRVIPYIKASRALVSIGNSREAIRVCQRGLAANPENEALQSLLAQLTGVPTIQKSEIQ